MKYLVLCTCSHSIDRHDAQGCGGDGNTPCRCLHNPDGALEAAIDHARLHPWDAWRERETLEPAS